MKKSENKDKLPEESHRFRAKPWLKLAFGFGLVWLFIFVICPWATDYIPLMPQIVQTIEERDINANAYFYTEIEASYDGEQYLRNSLELSAPQEIGLTLPFVLSIVLCILLLWIGYKYLPND
jgi:hypothetical protein